MNICWWLLNEVNFTQNLTNQIRSLILVTCTIQDPNAYSRTITLEIYQATVYCTVWIPKITIAEARDHVEENDLVLMKGMFVAYYHCYKNWCIINNVSEDQPMIRQENIPITTLINTWSHTFAVWSLLFG